MNLENQSNDILLKLFNESDIPTLNQLCRTNHRFAQLCNNQQLWKNRYIELFGDPNTSLTNWKEAFYNAIGLGAEVYVIKLRTAEDRGYEKYTEENIAVIEASDINYVYEKLATILNNNITANVRLYHALDHSLQYYNNEMNRYYTANQIEPEVYNPREHGEYREDLLIELPLSVNDLKHVLNFVTNAVDPFAREIAFDGPLPLLLLY